MEVALLEETEAMMQKVLEAMRNMEQRITEKIQGRFGSLERRAKDVEHKAEDRLRSIPTINPAADTTSLAVLGPKPNGKEEHGAIPDMQLHLDTIPSVQIDLIPKLLVTNGSTIHKLFDEMPPRGDGAQHQQQPPNDYKAEQHRSRRELQLLRPPRPQSLHPEHEPASTALLRRLCLRGRRRPCVRLPRRVRCRYIWLPHGAVRRRPRLDRKCSPMGEQHRREQSGYARSANVVGALAPASHSFLNFVFNRPTAPHRSLPTTTITRTCAAPSMHQVQMDSGESRSLLVLDPYGLMAAMGAGDELRPQQRSKVLLSLGYNKLAAAASIFANLPSIAGWPGAVGDVEHRPGEELLRLSCKTECREVEDEQ